MTLANASLTGAKVRQKPFPQNGPNPRKSSAPSPPGRPKQGPLGSTYLERDKGRPGRRVRTPSSHPSQAA